MLHPPRRVPPVLSRQPASSHQLARLFPSRIQQSLALSTPREAKSLERCYMHQTSTAAPYKDQKHPEARLAEPGLAQVLGGGKRGILQPLHVLSFVAAQLPLSRELQNELRTITIRLRRLVHAGIRPHELFEGPKSYHHRWRGGYC